MIIKTKIHSFIDKIKNLQKTEAHKKDRAQNILKLKLLAIFFPVAMILNILAEKYTNLDEYTVLLVLCFGMILIVNLGSYYISCNRKGD